MNIPKGYKLVPVDVDALAQFIRKIDGDNRMGAGTLAEHIAEWLELDALPIYDEDADRKACRKEWKRRNEHSHFEPIPFPDYWAGWKDCAQYRAKAGEDE